ncbi:small secreted protein [Dichomitus squalens LYAD-421 SS1]|uniref:Small secreted protein n=1 Tax=Dichomitus squalens TaxID=114155 RepID=A0A4Q9MNH4_9APHY|nr:small secreted protein [Dichomitus squalens LYAD-421 SS1]EJF62597.1 small secreted protein [Dichomitus squalens LYAD-421 SS1]TBU29035.1 small secreted protein [Dichomitus squalens]
MALTSLFYGLLLTAITSAGVARATDITQVNAIVGVNGNSTVECWTLTTDISITSSASVEQLGSIDSASYSYFPGPDPFDSGTHTAPNLQYFFIIGGGGTITFPADPSETLSVKPGQLYIAVDSASTSDLGHHTVINGGSLVLQLPFSGGTIPSHTATSGQCASS